MLTDVETRKLIAEEHVRLLRAHAEPHVSDQRTRRWLSQRLIAAGVRAGAGGRPAPEAAGGLGAAPDLEALGAVVRKRLPRRERADVEVGVRRLFERRVDRAQADARELRVGPAAAEEVRAADHAEGLGGALVRLVGADEVFAGEQENVLGADAPVGGADASGDLLAGRAVTEGHREEVADDFELDAAALAATSHVPSVPLRTSAQSGCCAPVKAENPEWACRRRPCRSRSHLGGPKCKGQHCSGAAYSLQPPASPGW